MVDVLTYKATKVYTPQTNEWADAAKTVQAAGKQLSSTLKDLSKREKVKENQAAAEQKALVKEKKTAYDKVLDAQADDFVQRYQIELVRQTQLINAQYKDDPANPEKENQIRAVGKDIQAQLAEQLPQENRQRFFQKAETKTNDYILSDLKANLKDQFDDFKRQNENNARQTLENIKINSVWGNFDGVHKGYIEGRENLENYVSGIMTPDQAAITLRQYDRQTITALIDGVAKNNPDFARELKNNPAAIASILSGGDYLTELATRSELNKGTEEIDGMTFDKNGRYQKEKERAKLVNSLGIVEIDYNNGGQPAKTLASSYANPELTKYVAELMGGVVGRDLDMSIKQAENVQKAKLEKATYDGMVGTTLNANYQVLDQLKNSPEYQKGDPKIVAYANQLEQALDAKADYYDKAAEMSDEDLNAAIDDFVKSLDKIDGQNITPIVDSYKKLTKVQAGLSVRKSNIEGQAVESEPVKDMIAIGAVTPQDVQKAASKSVVSKATELEQMFKNAVDNQDFRSAITQNLAENWELPGFFAMSPSSDKSVAANRQAEKALIKAQNEARMGFMQLMNQGRQEDAIKYYTDKKYEFYDNAYNNVINMSAVKQEWQEHDYATAVINGVLYKVNKQRDTSGKIVVEPLNEADKNLIKSNRTIGRRVAESTMMFPKSALDNVVIKGE